MPNGTGGAVLPAGGFDSDPFRRDAQRSGYIAYSMHLADAGSSAALATQILYLRPVFLKAGDLISNIGLVISVAAASLTLAKGALYALDGTLLQGGTEVSASINGATGRRALPLSASYTVTRDGYYYAACLFVGTTPPTVARGANNAAAGLGPIWDYAAMTAQTDLPATATLAGTSAAAIWVAVY